MSPPSGPRHSAVRGRPSLDRRALKGPLSQVALGASRRMDDQQLRSQRGGDMEYRVLGQVAAFRDGRQVALGSFRQRSLLAFLLMHATRWSPPIA